MIWIYVIHFDAEIYEIIKELVRSRRFKKFYEERIIFGETMNWDDHFSWTFVYYFIHCFEEFYMAFWGRVDMIFTSYDINNVV